MAVILLPGSAMEETISLSQLISLEDAGFEDAGFCSRDIDEEHVNHLAQTSAHELPAIEVVRVEVAGSVRCAVVDGNHRWNASTVRKETTIKARARTYPHENAVIDAAFQANLKHGLKASKITRTDYAVWIYLSDGENKLSMRQIAKMAKIDVAAVSRAIKKLDADDEAPGGTSRAEITSSKKLLNALHKFYAEERSLLSLGKGNGARDVQHRAKALYNHIASQPKEKHPELVQELASINETLTALMAMVKKPAGAKR